MADVMVRLREETRPLHERVEEAVDILSSCSDLGAYRHLLGRLLGLYEPIEAALAGFDWRSAGIDFEARRKAHRLASDLRVLGLSTAEQAGLPRHPSIRTPATRAGAFGMLYVVEGATLGGTVISRTVERALGLTATRGASFHHGYGEHNGARWREFRLAADAAVKGADEQREAVGQACATFEDFGSWLQRAKPEAPDLAAQPSSGMRR
ncbi:MAG: biliverdin-producing heme oxygenase [Caldimonas sp.]